MTTQFPVFDLGRFEAATASDRPILAQEVDQICRQSGFLAVGNHGVAQEVIDNVWQATRTFFALPPDEKQNCRAPYVGYPYGYLGPGAEALAASRGQKTPPDLKESFNGGPLAIPPDETDQEALAFCYAATIWPGSPAQFQTAWQEYYQAMENLAARIMRLFAAALGLPEEYFAPFIDAPISALRALNYPAQNHPPEPGQLRAGAHSDYGSLTILLPQANSEGLEILTQANEWQSVPPIGGAFVINIGDLMARWTNDRWVSTLHRVVNTQTSQSRQSLAFFHQPNWHAKIECLPSCLQSGQVPLYGSVASGPYLMDKFRSTAKG